MTTHQQGGAPTWSRGGRGGRRWGRVASEGSAGQKGRASPIGAVPVQQHGQLSPCTCP